MSWGIIVQVRARWRERDGLCYKRQETAAGLSLQGRGEESTHNCCRGSAAQSDTQTQGKSGGLDD